MPTPLSVPKAPSARAQNAKHVEQNSEFERHMETMEMEAQTSSSGHGEQGPLFCGSSSCRRPLPTTNLTSAPPQLFAPWARPVTPSASTRRQEGEDVILPIEVRGVGEDMIFPVVGVFDAHHGSGAPGVVTNALMVIGLGSCFFCELTVLESATRRNSRVICCTSWSLTECSNRLPEGRKNQQQFHLPPLCM